MATPITPSGGGPGGRSKTFGQSGGRSGRRRRVAIAEAGSRDQLDRLCEVFEANGIDFELEQDIEGGGSWRIFVSSSDALRARVALAAVMRRERAGARAHGAGAPAAGAGVAAPPSARPLFEGGSGGWLRIVFPLLFFALAAWLAFRG